MELYKRHLPAFLVIPAVVLVLFFPVVFQGKVALPLDMLNTIYEPFASLYQKPAAENHLVVDAILQYYPYKVFTREALLEGRMASWNPALLGGYPQYAETMASHFDITNLLLLAGPMPFAYHLQMMFQLMLAGFAMYVLLQVLRVSPAVALMFAVAYMLNNLFIATIFHRWLLASFCWLPLAIASAILFFQSRSLHYAGAAAMFLAAGFLGGHFQSSAFLTFTFVLFCTGFSTGRGEASPAPNPWYGFASSSLMVAAALLLSAIMWLPALELFQHTLSDGTWVASSLNNDYSLVKRLVSIPMLIGFFIPETLGLGLSAYSVRRFVTPDINQFNGFIGFIPLLFGVFGAAYFWKRRPEYRALILLAVLGILLPVATPLYKFIYHRFFVVSVFSFTILGALAFDAFRSGELKWEKFRPWFRWALAGVLVIFAGLALLNLVIWLRYEEVYPALRDYVMRRSEASKFTGDLSSWFLERLDNTIDDFSLLSPTLWLPFGTVFLTLGCVAAFAKGRLGSLGLTAGCFVLTLAHLMFDAQKMLPFIDPAVYPLYGRTEVTDFLREHLNHERFVRMNHDSDRFILYPNIPQMYGINDLSGYESMTIRSYYPLLQAVENSEYSADMLGLGNVRYVVARSAVPKDPRLVRIDSTELAVYENRANRPKAYMCYDFLVVPGRRELEQFILKGDYPRATAIFEKEPHRKVRHPDVAVPYEIHFRHLGNNYVKLELMTQRDGYLILSDSHYPGWRASVNGTEQEIMRANYAFRALYVPAGHSVVEYVFEPSSFRVGAWISAATAFVLMIVTIASGRRKNNE